MPGACSSLSRATEGARGEERAMTKVLTPAEVEAYRETGYHFPVDVLTPADVAAFRGELESYERQSGGPISGAMRHRSHVLFTWVNDMVRNPRILDAVEDVLGPNLLCWNT